ncbi:splicing factor 3b subunit [Cyclospora cayetanensis]|uniref:Splicing factor 3b subunit n=1 Tax=Cyclospora cayetanensis TaxID=88456 RepID=A0A1D3D311_9EIME|nr:splicing factor 3b subunit [Cyclospora cayetanensis]
MQLEGDEQAGDSLGTFKAGSGKWGSCLRIVNPLLATTIEKLTFETDEAAISCCCCEFEGLPLLIVGTVTAMTLRPKAVAAASIKVYAYDSNFRLTFLHSTPVEDVPQCFAPFRGMLLAGVGNRLRLYALGKKRLLRKCEYKNLPSGLVFLRVFEDRIFAGDLSESVHVLKYRANANLFYVLCDDSGPRWLTRGEVLDYHTIVAADKFDSLFIERVPSEARQDEAADVTGLKLRGDTAYMTDSCHKLDTVLQFHVGEIVTGLRLAALSTGSAEAIVYATIMGTIGSMVPFLSKEELDFFHHLEMVMRSEAPPLAGRDHLMFRSYYHPLKNVVDGDLCEQFVSLSPEAQSRVAQDFEKTPADILKRLEDIRNRGLSSHAEKASELACGLSLSVFAVAAWKKQRLKTLVTTHKHKRLGRKLCSRRGIPNPTGVTCPGDGLTALLAPRSSLLLFLCKFSRQRRPGGLPAGAETHKFEAEVPLTMGTRARTAGARKEGEAHPPKPNESKASILHNKLRSAHVTLNHPGGPQAAQVGTDTASSLSTTPPNATTAALEVSALPGPYRSKFCNTGGRTHAEERAGVPCTDMHVIEKLRNLRDRCLAETAQLPPLPNVYFNSSLENLAWCGITQERHQGSPQVKSFPIISHGFQEARRLARAWAVGAAHDRQGSLLPSETHLSAHAEAAEAFMEAEKMTLSLLRESLSVMMEDLVDLCSPRLRSALTPEQRNKFYGPLKNHAKHIRETQDASDLVGYMRLYFDRYMLEKTVPSEDASFARVFALLDALAAWAPPVKGHMKPAKPQRAIRLGADSCSQIADLVEDILSDKSSNTGTDAEAQPQNTEEEHIRVLPHHRLLRQRPSKRRRCT